MQARSTDVKPLKILQMSDAHYDPDYVVGGLARCDHPMCCSSDSGKARIEKEEAGYWGDYRECDPPRHTLVATFKHIAKQHVRSIFLVGNILILRSAFTSARYRYDILYWRHYQS